MMTPYERFGPLLSALLLLTSAICLVSAGNFKQEVEELAKADNGPIFDEDQDGYDKHADIYYYQDKQVATEYARAKYMATQVTLAGQAVDLTGRPVKPAVHPFAVAQRTFKQIGTLKDRWDVKDTGKEAQYLALYHGKGGDYVVNKVRAHLLRTLANAVNDLIPVLDRTAEPDAAQEHAEEVEAIRDNFRATIERVCREVDNDIRRSMPDNDDSKASATVVIISKNFVVTVGVGKGSVIAYDDDYERSNLVDQTGEDGVFDNHLFGVKKTRQESIQPRVQFHSRLDTNYQFLLIETPSVTATMQAHTQQKTDIEIVLSSINQHKDVEAQEQELYSSAVSNILTEIENSLSAFKRFFMHSDYSVILVGLETDYTEIH